MQRNDASIVALFWERKEEALTEARAAYGLYCTAVAENILHSRMDAEECVSDAFLAAWDSIPPNRPEKLKFYLARIVRNAALNRAAQLHAEKRGGGELPLLLSELADDIPETTDAAAAPETEDSAALGALLDRFVRTLPKRERIIFVKRYFYSLSSAEIARLLGLTENHVNVLLSRTRKKLKTELEREGYSV